MEERASANEFGKQTKDALFEIGRDVSGDRNFIDNPYSDLNADCKINGTTRVRNVVEIVSTQSSYAYVCPPCKAHQAVERWSH
jgi:hypothetical protein